MASMGGPERKELDSLTAMTARTHLPSAVLLLAEVQVHVHDPDGQSAVMEELHAQVTAKT
jgi:hypothetical protein